MDNVFFEFLKFLKNSGYLYEFIDVLVKFLEHGTKEVD